MACLSQAQQSDITDAQSVLEVGCGPKRVIAHSTTVDISPKSKADVIHDLNTYPYPFEDDQFDYIIAEHVLEHLQDVVRTLEEFHRITKADGVIFIEVPHFSSADFPTDPTHTHAFGIHSMDYFEPADSGKFCFHYSDSARFKVKKAEMDGPSRHWWQRVANHYARKNPSRFEKQFAYIFPRSHINYELRVLK